MRSCVGRDIISVPEAIEVFDLPGDKGVHFGCVEEMAWELHDSDVQGSEGV